MVTFDRNVIHVALCTDDRRDRARELIQAEEGTYNVVPTSSNSHSTSNRSTAALPSNGSRPPLGKGDGKGDGEGKKGKGGGRNHVGPGGNNATRPEGATNTGQKPTKPSKHPHNEPLLNTPVVQDTSDVPILRKYAQGEITVSGSPESALVGATVAFCVGFSMVSLFSPTASHFKDMLQLSDMDTSWLMAAPLLSGSLLRIPFSAMVDSNGGRKPFLALLFLSLVGMGGLILVLSKAQDLIDDKYPVYKILFGLGVLVGCGGASFSVGAGQLSYWFAEEDQGFALGVYAGVGHFGPGIMIVALPFLQQCVPITYAYAICMVLLVLGMILYRGLVHNAWYFQLCKQGALPKQAESVAFKLFDQEVFPRGDACQSLCAAMGNQWTFWLTVIYFATFGGLVGLTLWFPRYWSEYFGYSATYGGSLAALFSLFSTFIWMLAGYLSDDRGGEFTMMFATAVMAVGAGVLTFAGSDEFELAVSGEVLLAAGMGMANAAVYKLIPQLVPEAIGGASGWIGGLGCFGGFAVLPVMGYFVEHYEKDGYAYGFSVFLAMSCIAFLVAAWLRCTAPAMY